MFISLRKNRLEYFNFQGPQKVWNKQKSGVKLIKSVPLEVMGRNWPAWTQWEQGTYPKEAQQWAAGSLAPADLRHQLPWPVLGRVPT